ncbi:MAG: hypothetical protein QXH91_09385 [Candidatus Bathyarchaeia archaeon]
MVKQLTISVPVSSLVPDNFKIEFHCEGDNASYIYEEAFPEISDNEAVLLLKISEFIKKQTLKHGGIEMDFSVDVTEEEHNCKSKRI